MSLELKHISPYLPYGLKGRVDKETYIQEENERIGELKTIDLADHQYHLAVYNDLGYFLSWIDEFKPILRPLSDLMKEIEVNGEKFVPFDEIRSYSFELNNNKKWQKVVLEDMPYSEVQKLFEWHFDVFGLIEKGLAVDINTLNQEK
ncbi:hypothetical protein ACTS9E_04265 [Empedobacter brevis]